MSIPFSTFLNVMVSKLDSNKPNIRRMLNLKPHAVILDADYLRSIGLNTQQIAKIHLIAAAKAASNKGGIEGIEAWNKSTGVLTLIGGNNFARAQDITRTINKMLEVPRGITTAPVSVSGGTIEETLSNIKGKTTKDISRGLQGHGINITQSLLLRARGTAIDSELIVTVAPVGGIPTQKARNEMDAAFIQSLPSIQPEAGVISNIDNAILASFLGQSVVTNTSIQSGREFQPGRSSKPTFELLSRPTGTLNIFSIRNVLNALLHGTVQKVMRDTNDAVSKNYLRYRTGRFADSTRVTNVFIGKTGNLNLNYTYLKYPYDTFRPPKGVQSSTGRDPRVIVKKAIRIILKDYVSDKIKIRSTLI